MRRRALLAASIGGNGAGPNDAPVDVNYLTIEALEDGLTASLSLNACEYCVDGNREWRTLEADTNTISINAGQTLSFKGRLSPVDGQGIGTFTISKKCNLKGNCMSMLFDDYAAYNNDLSTRPWVFYSLFTRCPIVSVSNDFLPSKSLAYMCYSDMFAGCTNLTNAPKLPAIWLADYCYSDMFYGCTSLIAAPTLPATRLTEDCYFDMFAGCTSLIAAPALPATTLTHGCYFNMFKGCTSLVNAPKLPATTLADYCYYGMFYECANLTTAPALPATTLTNSCYREMFYRCTKLNYIKMLATDIPESSCLSNWVYKVASTGTFVKNPAMTSLPTGSSGIPSGWAIENNGEGAGSDGGSND